MKKTAAAFLLAALFLAAHLPFLPVSLEDLDSINFALGVQHFDVAHHQPHPPGYPLFILVAKAARAITPSDASALSLVSCVAGALSVLALVALFRRIDPEHCRPRFAWPATLLTVTAPLYWFTAARPLSDMAGLAAAIAVQALTLSASTAAALAGAAFCSGFATGLRSQVAWLTVPLLIFAIVRRPAADRARTAALSAIASAIGALAWAVPLVVLTGGPRAYWHAIFDQGAEDLTGIQMLWTTPTRHQLMAALQREFVAPWTSGIVSAAIVALAIIGMARMWRISRSALTTLAIAFVPYLVFDLLFQETVTVRYALPIVVPTAYLAMRGLMPSTVEDRPHGVFVVGVLVVGALLAHMGGTALAGYASAPAPAFRLLADMRQSLATRHTGSPALAMHRREALDLRRPIAATGGLSGLNAQLPLVAQHEWLSALDYWNQGGHSELWFVADPARTDLALIDLSQARRDSYRWPFERHELVGGVRPDVMDWFRVRQPGWYLGEGWALTPETAGIAAKDGRSPDRAPILGWIRRRSEELALMVGGRNLASGGPPARVSVSLDGRIVDEVVASPGFFLRMLTIPAGALAGSGDYARLSIASGPNIAIEQFNAQSSDRIVFGFGEGWNEQEFSTTFGRMWRWTSDRSVLRVHAAGHSLMLTLRGEAPLVSHWRSAHVTVSAGGRVISEQTFTTGLDIQVRIPAELLPGNESTITIETDRSYVPAEGWRKSQDRRRLGLRVFECDLRPVS